MRDKRKVFRGQEETKPEKEDEGARFIWANRKEDVCRNRSVSLPT